MSLLVSPTRRRPTPPFEEAVSQVREVDDHVASYRRAGDERASAGAVQRLRLALLQVAAVDAHDRRALRRKVKILAGRDGLWDDQPLGRLLIAAALASNMDALGLDEAARTAIANQMFARTR